MAENNAFTCTLGLLTHLSIDELKEVLNDDVKFENLTTDIIKDANNTATEVRNSEKEMLVASNKSLAEYNLSRSVEFQEKKRELIDVYDELTRTNSLIQEKSSKLKELTSKSNSEVVLGLLQNAAAEVERETDEIAEKFLNGEIKLQEFLDQFPNRRKLMHLRKAKAEKMTDLVNRRLSYKGPQIAQQPSPRITTMTQSNVRSTYLPNYSNAPVSVPYPLGPVNMPMPKTYMPNHF